jgi:hypothetical protein
VEVGVRELYVVGTAAQVVVPQFRAFPARLKLLTSNVVAFADALKVDGASTGPTITGKRVNRRTFVSALAIHDGFSQVFTPSECRTPNTVKDFRE